MKHVKRLAGQKLAVLRLLEAKAERGLTGLDALQEANVWRLASRISDLKRLGISISKTMVTTTGGAKIARYRLSGPVEAVDAGGGDDER